MAPHFLRLAYVSQFLLALVAIFELWSQVGGQGHLDLMPWYTKLLLTSTLALVIVMGTASAVGHERAWNAKSIACLLLGLALAVGMGLVTYYYHLHEGNDEDCGDSGVAISVVQEPPAVRPS